MYVYVSCLIKVASEVFIMEYVAGKCFFCYEIFFWHFFVEINVFFFLFQVSSPYVDRAGSWIESLSTVFVSDGS